MTAKEILDEISKLSKEDQEIIRSTVLNMIGGTDTLEEYVADKRFSNGRICPLCGSTKVVRNGHRKDGTQRFVCKDCKKSFVATSNSVAARTRKDMSVWNKYFQCMMFGASLKESAEFCGIHINTAFVWRHKILDALQEMAEAVVLDGIVEADETFFATSFKGNHKSFVLPRAPRYHSTVHTRGISKEQACVSCAVNRNGLSIAKVTNLGRATTEDINKALGGRIKPETTIVTDKLASYRKFSDENDLNLIQLKADKSKNGIYNLSSINNYHSQLKTFMRKFNGVSTKYLNNYLIWYNMVKHAKNTFTEKEAILKEHVLTTQQSSSRTSISQKEALPK